jgi:hypothetical protein
MISITEFKVVFICPDHNEKYHQRKIHMENMLKNIGFTNIEHYKSSTEDYPDCLSKATIDILENNLDGPILIVEDDIEWTGIDSIEYHSTYDAIYLGISRSGGHPTINLDQGHSIYEYWSTYNVRVMNMLSAHAILYLSRSYKEAVITILRAHLGVKYYNDVLMSRIQAKYLVLATKKPVFYQSVLFGNDIHVQNFTNFVIE